MHSKTPAQAPAFLMLIDAKHRRKRRRLAKIRLEMTFLRFASLPLDALATRNRIE
jgi:hypothetical protein